MIAATYCEVVIKLKRVNITRRALLLPDSSQQNDGDWRDGDCWRDGDRRGGGGGGGGGANPAALKRDSNASVRASGERSARELGRVADRAITSLHPTWWRLRRSAHFVERLVDEAAVASLARSDTRVSSLGTSLLMR